MSKKALNKLLLAVTLAVAFTSSGSKAYAICVGRFLNPVTDICWQCILPVKIGGIMVAPGPPDTPDLTSAPVCACPFPPPIFVRIGIPVSFWEPARYIETVKDPYCFPALGMGLTNPAEGFLGGTSKPEKTMTFQQAHYFIYPVWSLLSLMVDVICVQGEGFDVAYITEIDPLWNNDTLAAIIEPEAILFANPIAQMACVADAASALVWYPLAPLFWCQGSWGTSAYPLTGSIDSEDYVSANAGIAARMLYKMGRLLLLCDTNYVTLCSCVMTPIWKKDNYRFQIAMPVRDFWCQPIGRSGLVWSYGKNPPYMGAGTASDNFVWMVFRKHGCCMF